MNYTFTFGTFEVKYKLKTTLLTRTTCLSLIKHLCVTMKTIKRTCQYCQFPFDARLSEVNRGNCHFCSRRCVSLYIKSQRDTARSTNVTCAYCRKPFYKTLSKQQNSHSGLFFCCGLHKDEAQRIGGIKEIQPPHYGTGNWSRTYRSIAFRHQPPRCKYCGYSKYQGVLEVHHIDENRDNNDPSNLEIVCPTCHVEQHFLRRTGKHSSHHPKR